MSGPKDGQAAPRERTGRRLFWLSFIVAAVAVLFGWSAAENASDLRTCELAVGALNNADARIDIQRVTAPSFTRVIRIDYTVTQPGDSRGWSRFVSCRFAAGNNPPFTENLVAMDTESGPLPDSKLYLMRRFFLDTKDARGASLPFATGNAPDAAGIAAHSLEWFFSVLSRASLYGVLAGLYLWYAALSGPAPVYRTLRRAAPDTPPPGGLRLQFMAAFEPGQRWRTCLGLLAAPLAMAGALAMTSTTPFLPAFWFLPIFLSILAGLTGLSGLRLAVEESRLLAANDLKASIGQWLFFFPLIGLALYGFPSHGLLPVHDAPAWLFRPLRLFGPGGYGTPVTPLAMLTVVAALLFLAAGIIGRSTRAGREPSPLQQRTGLIAVPFFTGIVIADSYLQFGLALNPLLIGTKAALIAVIALTLTTRDRYLAVLPVALATVTVEYAAAPFLSITTTNATSYAVLALALYLLRTRRLYLFTGR